MPSLPLPLTRDRDVVIGIGPVGLHHRPANHTQSLAIAAAEDKQDDV